MSSAGAGAERSRVVNASARRTAVQARFQTRFQTAKGKAFGRIEFKRSGDLACKLPREYGALP